MSMADLQRRVSELELNLRRLEHRVPVRLGLPPGGPKAIFIIGGQSFGAVGGITTYGIKKFSGTLASITTQTYDPGTVNATTGAQTGAPSPALTAWPDGLGFGTMFDGVEYSRVIVVNDSRGTGTTALIGGASDDTTYAPTWRTETILSQRVLSVTLADATTIEAWSPDLS